MKKVLCSLLFVLVGMPVIGVTQSMKPASMLVPATRYFKLTTVLRFPSNTELEPASQSITTEVAVGINGKQGSCRARMTSQVPIGTGMATKFIDVGTKFDCNDVRLEDEGLALSIVIETSRLTGMVALKDHAGVETQEPIISSRTVSLAVKLPLNTPKVIFDLKSVDPSKLKRLPLGESAKDGQIVKDISLMQQDAAMQIEMTASELK